MTSELSNKVNTALNTKQRLSVEKINEFIRQDTHRYFHLHGSAGTGKTFLLSKIIQDLLKNNKMDQIFICAPTHQALNVIESYFRSTLTPNEQKLYLTKINFMTIQKLLEFKPIIANEDGTKIFKSTRESKFLKQMNDKLIIIDECSMLAIDMTKELDKYTNLYPIKIVFLGDSAQLPPVKERESLVFINIPKDYTFHIVLDEIMRTKSPDIKEVATIIRQWNQKDPIGKLLLPIHNRNNKNKNRAFGLYHKKTDYLNCTWFKKFIKKLKTDEIPIILTWRNAMADMYNKIIRQHIHGSNNIANYLKGDFAMFNDYYTSPEDGTSFYTANMIKILDISTEDRLIFDWSTLLIENPVTIIEKNFNKMIKNISKMKNKFGIDIFTVEKVQNDAFFVADDKTHIVQTINRTDLEEYQEVKNKIKESIEVFFRINKSEKYVKKLWDIYYKRMCDPYATISYGYSITTYKAQGSTFNSVFVDADDICENPDIDEMQKMLYTATTRASAELGFIVA